MVRGTGINIYIYQVRYDPRNYERNLCYCGYSSLNKTEPQRGLNGFERV